MQQLLQGWRKGKVNKNIREKKNDTNPYALAALKVFKTWKKKHQQRNWKSELHKIFGEAVLHYTHSNQGLADNKSKKIR